MDLKGLYFFVPMLCFFGGHAQQSDQKPQDRKINIVYGGTFTKDEAQFPGASIFSKDDQRQVQFEHQGADMWCDIAIFYTDENRIRALGNIRLQQGDSIEMNSGRMDYDGNSKLAKAWKAVDLTNGQMTLTTDTLYFDREKQLAYYNSGGKVVDSVNVLTSRLGTYFIEPKKYQFQEDVHIDNPDNIIDSQRLDYYTTSKNVYMYGPSTITGEDYKMYCERGYYNTVAEQGYGIKNTRIDYDFKIIEGDSLYFDKFREFASATNNIKITDTINDGVIRAHYAEVHKAKDSVFATKRAVSISLVQNDSLYMHGDTLMATGPPDNRIIRAFRNAKWYKTDLSGKCDSIHFNESTGLTQLIRDPILWNVDNQITGDSIHLISDMETEKLDSLKVIENAFIISLDTIGGTGYNQAKGKNLYGKFIDNELKIIDLVSNTEVIYYVYNDDEELLGINKTICSKIRLIMENSDIEDITFYVNPDGDIFPEKDLPVESRKLKGFIWRGEERIMSKDEIFDEDDNTIELVKIRGVNSPIDMDAEEEERRNNENDPVNKINSQGVRPTRALPQKADPS